MRAIAYERFGAPVEVLFETDIATPDPQPGEVLVRLSYSGVNPSDAKARAGSRPGVTAPPYPLVIPHSDGAGVITAVGEGIPKTRIGERVWIWNGQWQRAYGTAAEYIALPSEQAVALPESVPEQTGATLGIPGLTAAQAVFGGGDVAGQTLLISGGAGSVGHIAVQLASAAGARVISTASPAGIPRVLAAGADSVFDYSDPELSQRLLDATDSAGFDRAIEVEFGSNVHWLADVMKPNSTVLTYGSGRDMTPVFPFGPYLFKAIKIDILLIYLLSTPLRNAAITRLHSAIEAGNLTPAIAEIMPLSNCALAHEAVMRPGRQGAVLLNISA